MTFRARDQIQINQKRKHFIYEGEHEHRRKGKNFRKSCFLEQRLERKLGNYLEQDGLADGQTLKSE